MRIHLTKAPEKFFTSKPFTLKYHYKQNQVEGDRSISLSKCDKAKVILATIAGVLLGGIGAPILFFYVSKKLREKKFEQLKTLTSTPEKTDFVSLKKMFNPDLAARTYLEKELQKWNMSSLQFISEVNPLPFGKKVQIHFEKVQIYFQIQMGEKRWTIESTLQLLGQSFEQQKEEILKQIPTLMTQLAKDVTKSGEKLDLEEMKMHEFISCVDTSNDKIVYAHSTVKIYGSRFSMNGGSSSSDIATGLKSFHALLKEEKITPASFNIPSNVESPQSVASIPSEKFLGLTKLQEKIRENITWAMANRPKDPLTNSDKKFYMSPWDICPPFRDGTSRVPREVKDYFYYQIETVLSHMTQQEKSIFGFHRSGRDTYDLNLDETAKGWQKDPYRKPCPEPDVEWINKMMTGQPVIW